MGTYVKEDYQPLLLALLVRYDGGQLGLTESRAGMGRPVPVPPQLLHDILPEPAHVRHPTSLSDHLEHRHVTRPLPSHVGHLGQPPAPPPPAIGLLSKAVFTSMAPARTPNPVASCDTITSGPMALKNTLANTSSSAGKTGFSLLSLFRPSPDRRRRSLGAGPLVLVQIGRAHV